MLGLWGLGVGVCFKMLGFQSLVSGPAGTHYL